jgi:catechol 2,3-dioxygenase-like lactoylglutathione lyase family enzyme
MDAMVEFYRDCLKMRVVKDFTERGAYIDTVLGLSGAEVRMVKLAAEDGSMVELLQFPSHPGQAPAGRGLATPGCTHLAFTVKDVGEAFRELSGKGVAFVSEPTASPDGYARVAFCKDPEGFHIELVEVL